MGESGEMARLPELLKFARKHKLKICTIEALIKFRRAKERLVERVEAVQMPTEHGDFQLYLYRSTLDGQHHRNCARRTDFIGGNTMHHKQCAATAT